MSTPHCPRHPKPMAYRIWADDFFCGECGFTITSKEHALTDPPPATPISDSQLGREIAEPSSDA